MTDTTITQDADVMTLVNVFTVEPENQQELVEILIQATDAVMCDLPGFISANVHRSGDGTRVINYAQWARREDFEAMRKEARAAGHMEARGRARPIRPGGVRGRAREAPLRRAGQS